MKAVKLLAMVASINLMLCGCGNDVHRQDALEHAPVLQFVSYDEQWRVIGPVWDCSRQIGGKCHYPILITEKGKDGRVYWCHEVSRGSSGNFDVASEDGLFYLSDSSFCHSDEMKVITYMDFVSGAVTNRVELKRIDL